jgi:sulfur carrier protein
VILVQLNGAAHELPADATVASALAELELSPDERGVAVAVQGEVVPRGQWARRPLCAGDRVEVVRAVQGG